MNATNQEIYSGLTREEVLKSRELYGVNQLTPPRRPSVWKLYLEKFQDPIIRILLVAAFLSLIISFIEKEFAETIGIICAILLATGIGFYFEYDAGKKFDLLNAEGEKSPVKVRRNGKVTEIPRKEVVVGDVVLLDTGEEIPADGELLYAVSLQVNESALTGEPLVEKSADAAKADPEATYPSDRVMRGTTVADGYGVMRVLQVGDRTEIGKVAILATERIEEPTPLNKQLDKLADLIGKVGFTVAVATFIVFTARDLYTYFSLYGITGWNQLLPVVRILLKYFMMAVTLIVVVVPEGLPMSVTLSLALNMRRMLATNNLVRKMHACETMGAITVICTDKTGTLTQNRMQVAEAILPVQDLVPEAISVNTTAFLEDSSGETVKGVGNPTEVALLLWLRDRQFHYEEIRRKIKIMDQLPFSTERKYMATLVRSEACSGKNILYVKGAPEIIFDKCLLFTGTEEKEAPVDIQQLEEQLLAYQQKAMRTLAFAWKVVPEEKTGAGCEELVAEGGLTCMGVVAISDPIRPDVPDAVTRCRDAGIDIKIITGDTPATATEIARQIGLWDPRTDTRENRITGSDFEGLTDEEALERVGSLKIMSRARPGDKQRLVQLLQERGAVVAVTGDGTNDATALNRAQVGLSMGSGTAVAKEASDITLLDDSFNSIDTAVMWGRSLYKNIQRFIVFQLTINLVALLIVLIGAFMGTELPLTVTQMLWVNLIMDTFAAMALASIPPSASVMKEKPRKSTDFIISPRMMWNILVTGFIFISILLGLLWHYNHSSEGVSLYRLTFFFMVFVMLQFWNLFNARVFGTTGSAFRGLAASYGTLLVAAIILVGQYLIVQFGGAVFRTVPLTLHTWLLIISTTSLVLWGGEVVRFIQRLTGK
ncbi:MAG: calcium-translocating P-type ATPase, PMCA-type [Bacteroides sp.]|nr:calcium-translocating P-type ATPase, PMCA-type [Bacteroides sp.]